MQLAQDKVIAGRFRLNRQLGKGGMGSVWHATHLGLDIPCAVKFIEGEFAQHPEAQARFEREAKASAALRSPHIIQILDHGVFEETPYIAMELLDGEDLGKRLTRVGRMQPQEISTIITQVCRALSKAHGAGIVHRDLKPDNIFLVKDDDREIAKVLDFGIAKANGNAIEGSNTKTGAMLGTPYYMSPEQAQGTKTVDTRSDLWSLAVIVYQAVTGQLPFESEALGDLLVKIIVQPIPVPSRMAQGLPPQFDKWWERAANRDPALRFQTAKEFAESLQLVFGFSDVTETLDRSQVNALIAQAQGAAVGARSQSMPSLHDVGAVEPVAPHRPFNATTGGMGYAGTAGIPKKGSGLGLVAAAVAVVLVGGGIAGVTLMKRGTNTASAASSQPMNVAPTETKPVETKPVAPNVPAVPPPTVDTQPSVPTVAVPTTAPKEPDAKVDAKAATKTTPKTPVSVPVVAKASDPKGPAAVPATPATSKPTVAKPATPPPASKDMGF
ncbi:MAG: protein kinase [Polyangiaceae bacterium]